MGVIYEPMTAAYWGCVVDIYDGNSQWQQAVMQALGCLVSWLLIGLALLQKPYSGRRGSRKRCVIHITYSEGGGGNVNCRGRVVVVGTRSSEGLV